MSTLYDKILKDHIVREEDGTILLYIDRHIVHEVTSPQAFEGLRNAGRRVRRPDLTLCTVDHNVPTTSREDFKDAKSFISEPDSRLQVMTLDDNVKAFGLTYFGMKDGRQGIVHVIGPEQGFSLPGTTIVCGDSHTSTHGAFGALAFGIGTSEVEHVLATQTLLQKRAKNMRIRVTGELGPGVTSKDIILHTIGVIGTAGGTGCVVEYCGDTIERLSMEARMSICNMSIEAGARAGLIAPDETTFKYLEGRPLAPKGAEWDAAVKYWRSLRTDADAKFDVSVDINAAHIQPTVSWGTSPQDVVPIGGKVPVLEDIADPEKRKAVERALKYMALEPGTPMQSIKVDKVFIGSCTNSRIEDLRAAAAVARGRRVNEKVEAMVVPGSGLVKEQAEAEGLDRVFIDAGFDWREAGCSMCLGMNEDKLKPGERCASTSNRNFQNRQGPGGRTHLMSPAMAAAAAIAGHLTDVRELQLTHTEPPKVPASVALDAEPPSAPSESKQEEPSVVSDVQSQSAGAPKGHVTTLSTGLPRFTTLEGVAAPLDRSNVDTDLIIQARHLKTIARTGLGQFLFEALRSDSDGQPVPNFFLNDKKYDSSPILVVSGPNFGCGSSREHAGWSLIDRGIRCVIASSFGDIFATNYGKNGALTVTLPAPEVAKLFADAEAARKIVVDLPNQVVRRENGEELHFEVDQFRKNCLIEGRDDIGLTELHADDIASYENLRKQKLPFYEGIGSTGRVLAPTYARQGKRRTRDW